MPSCLATQDYARSSCGDLLVMNRRHGEQLDALTCAIVEGIPSNVVHSTRGFPAWYDHCTLVRVNALNNLARLQLWKHVEDVGRRTSISSEPRSACSRDWWPRHQRYCRTARQYHVSGSLCYCGRNFGGCFIHRHIAVECGMNVQYRWTAGKMQVQFLLLYSSCHHPRETL
jgi:hypothetical protein